MARLKAALGYIAAVWSSVIMLATMPAIMLLSEPLLKATGLTQADKYTGGPVAQTLDHGGYQTQVHKASFQALLGESQEGFIQVNWAPRGGLPPRLEEEVDANGDGQADLRLEVDTAAPSAALTPYVAWAVGIEGPYQLKDSLMVRVLLENPRR